MPINYQKLYAMMENRKVKKVDLRKYGIHAKVVDSLMKGKNVNMSTIEQLCAFFDCQPADILEYVPEPPEPRE